jgi:hypothetical protein
MNATGRELRSEGAGGDDEAVSHGVQGIHDGIVVSLGDTPAEPLRGLNLAAHSNCP